MKIGLVCPYNIARGGGVQEIVRAMRHELQKRGHTVKIITPRPREVGNTDTKGILFIGTATDFNSSIDTSIFLSMLFISLEM